MIILLHSSKTMRPANDTSESLAEPVLLDKAKRIDRYLKTLAVSELQSSMKVSEQLAQKVAQIIANWSTNSDILRPAIDAFLGDIYSGLQVTRWSTEDRNYANSHLYILSGLYGIVRALDGIAPYRVEMAYKFPSKEFSNLYTFWGDKLAHTLPTDQLIVNLASVEYSKAVLPFLADRTIITPVFLTMNHKTNRPTFVAVHAKIARGAFARWMIQNRIATTEELLDFTEIGYSYDPSQSTPDSPVYVCETFGGIGLSMRLS